MIKKIITIFSIAVLLYSCGSESGNNNSYDDGFNRSELLTNLTDNIIIPSYNNFQQELINLEQSAINFTNNTDQDNLESLRSSWLDAYMAWQHIEMFDIAKAEEIDFRRKMNAYPCNTIRIDINISSENYDLNNSNHYSAQGFPALDYLLNGLTDPIILFSGNDGQNYINYLNSLIQYMLLNTNEIINEWNNNRDLFINSTENTASSSLNKLTNDFIFYYEKGFRANKIGIPAGVFSGSPLPENVEAYYHNLNNNTTSKNLALEAFVCIQKFFVGQYFDNSSEGTGISDYLNHLNAQEQGNNLSDLIISTFDEAELAITELDQDLMSQINTNNYDMLVTYDKIQAAVPLLKIDMLVYLSIDVDYIDADGD